MFFEATTYDGHSLHRDVTDHWSVPEQELGVHRRSNEEVEREGVAPRADLQESQDKSLQICSRQ